MSVKRYVLLVIVTICMIGLCFYAGSKFNSAKKMYKAKVVGNTQIENITDELYMNETSVIAAEAYEIRRIFPNSNETQAVVYIDKESGKILNRDVKDRAYIKE